MAIMCESEQCKAKVSELKEKEEESDDILKDAMRLWSAHEVTCHPQTQAICVQILKEII